MKKVNVLLLTFVSLLLIQFAGISAAEKAKVESKSIPANEKVVIIWTSADKEVATNMVLMYAENAKKYNWWEDITLVVWGPSQNLLLKDKELQEIVNRIRESGVVVKACKGCAERYGIVDAIAKLGVIVEYIDLTGYIKEGRNVLTF